MTNIDIDDAMQNCNPEPCWHRYLPESNFLERCYFCGAVRVVIKDCRDEQE